MKKFIPRIGQEASTQYSGMRQEIKLTERGKLVVAAVAAAALGLTIASAVTGEQEPVEPACAVVVNDGDSLWKIGTEANGKDVTPDEVVHEIASMQNPDVTPVEGDTGEVRGLHPGDYVGLSQEACEVIADNPDSTHQVVPIEDVPVEHRPTAQK